MHHRAIGRRQSGGFQNALKEVIAALEFIPKGEIALRQLKIFEVARLSDSLAQNVGRREEPAAAAGFLIGYLHGFHFVIEQEAPLRGVFAVENHFVQRLMTHGQRRRLHDGVRAIGVVHRGEHVACNLHGKTSFARRRSSDATMILR